MWTFQQFLPPGARGKFNAKLLTERGWFAEEKLDGDRRIAQFCSDAVRFTGRVISKVNGLMVEKTDNVPHLSGQTLPGLVPDDMLSMVRKLADGLEGTVLDGEMICDWQGARSRDVTSIMGSLPKEAVRKQIERGWVTYVVFDCLFWKGDDIRHLPLARRRLIAAEAVEKWGNPRARMVTGALENRGEFLDEIWARQGEGIILKRIDSAYGNENAWVKVKREETYDVVITGFDPPKDVSTKVSGETSVTKYAAEGLIGAIRFGQYKDGKLVECGACSGFDDDVRRKISKDPKSFIGSVMEITAQLREESGKFRHPRFGQFRDNKMAEQCIWGQT